MCGIVGYVKNSGVAINKLGSFITEGLIIDSVRGTCGTGIAGLNVDQAVADVTKRAVPGWDFVTTDGYGEFLRNLSSYKAVIGHNRAQTVGQASNANCHPFRAFYKEHDHIVLVHNGTVNNYASLSPRNFAGKVDSSHVAAGMSAFGELKTLQDASGWFIFVWVNVTKNTFNIARHGSRELTIVKSPDGKDMYYASERDMLLMLLRRAGLSQASEPVEIKEDEWLTWDLSKPDLNNPTVRSFRKVTPITHHRTTYSHGARSTFPQTLIANKYTYKDQSSVGVVVDNWTKWESANKLSPNNTYGFCTGVDHEHQDQRVVILGVSQLDWEAIKDPTIRQCVLANVQRVVKPGEDYNKDGKTDLLVCSMDHTSLRNTLESAARRKKAAEAPVGASCSLPAVAKEGPSATSTTTSPASKPASQIPLTHSSGHVSLTTISVPGPRGDLISLEEWRRATQDGCAQCSAPIIQRDFTKILWVGEYMRTPLCHTCSETVTREQEKSKTSSPVASGSTTH